MVFLIFISTNMTTAIRFYYLCAITVFLYRCNGGVRVMVPMLNLTSVFTARFKVLRATCSWCEQMISSRGDNHRDSVKP